MRPALPRLLWLISQVHQDEEVLTDACWALSYVSDGPSDDIESVVAAGVCRPLVDLLAHKSSAVVIPALRTVGNIVTGSDLQTQPIIDAHALPKLLGLLESPKEEIRKDAAGLEEFGVGTPERNNLEASLERSSCLLMFTLHQVFHNTISCRKPPTPR